MAELVGGALLSALLNPLVEKLASEVKDFFKGKEAILKLLKEFKTLLSSADLLLIDAEEKLIKDHRVRKWLDDLKDAVYDADDLVYKIDTEAWRNQLELEVGGPHESHTSCFCSSKALMRLISSTPLTSFDKNIKPEIEETLEKLKFLLDHKDLGLERVRNHKKPERVCGPLVEESDVYGRDVDKEAIVKLLRSDDTTGGDKLSVIPVVGMGGIGKTTLAQLVYNDDKVIKMFDTRVWVTVGDDDKVNSSKVMKTIILKVASAKCESEEEFEVLNEVKKVLAGKKFLIVLDDVWDEAWRNKLEGGDPHESHRGCSCTSKALLRLISSTPLTSFDKNIKPEIEETLGKLKLLMDNKDLGLERVKNHKLPKRVCAPLVEESDVYGRDGDKEAIINLLLLDDKFSVIPIVGMGGIGKTTLAQLVYNDARVTKMFDTRVWVTVGDDDKVNSSKVMKTIILKVKSAKCKFEEEFEVLNEVKEVLSGKKFLIVLDDVWDEDSNRWEAIKSTFKSGLHGSKIIVTTRSTRVASIMGTKSSSTYFLSTISFDKGWELFVRYAAIDVNSHEYSDLQVIGRKIVEKCNGLPLAIKSLGGLLRGKQNKEDWDDILNNDIWELYERESVGILPALWLSYFYLPSHLKSCFSYCAIFPKDYEYSQQEMIILWMADGLLLPKKEMRIEDIGRKYFKDLISMSFFQPSNNNYEVEPIFLMHDLIHDLAMFISGDFCSTMNKINKCSSKVRHFSYMQQCAKADDPKEFEDLFKAKCLRTLLWEQGPSSDQLRLLKIEDLDKSFPVLRVLSIQDYSIIKLPDSIGNLKYLRYLKLYCKHIEEIPNTICKLYNLETLLLETCGSVKRLPNDIGNLIKLRHLSVPVDSLEEMLLQLGKLQNLQTLNAFVVGTNRDCGGIELLKVFQDLHGSLSIKGLQNVNVSRLEEVSDAAAPLLKSKKSLSQLELKWNRDHYPKLDELHKERELLNALQPHPNLRQLRIFNYGGNSFPDWMGDHHCLSNLVILNIVDCRNCSFLPSLGQLPSLKVLFIVNCSVVRIDLEFYCSTTLDSSSSVAIQTKPLFFTSLETLAFITLSKLEEWSFIERGGFPRLKNLHLYDCSRLKVTLLGDYFPSLTELEIDGCGEIIPLLLPRAQLNQAPLITLKKIKFRNCPNLTHLDEEAFQHLTSLEELMIDKCPNLECLPKELPTSLSELHIWNCPLLRPRVERETGEDWPIIAHIPNIIVEDSPSLDVLQLILNCLQY